MKTKKVCLVNPPTSRDQDELFFPMGPLVLATVLRQNEVPVELADFELAFRKRRQLREDPALFENWARQVLMASGADTFGISSICSNFPYALQIARLIRKAMPEAKIILGGPQPSSVPVKTLETFSDIDVIVVGEGERTLIDLISSDWSPEALAKVPGLAYRRADGQAALSAARPLIDDLDELPIPDFSVLNLWEYLQLCPTIAVIEAGRGCPFDCSFCSTATFWSRKYRAKSPGRILAEMENLHRSYGMSTFSLTHDNFTTSPKYVRSFTEYFEGHNQRNFTWSSSARTDSLLRCDPRGMKRAGCRSLFLGVDTGSQRMQEKIDKHLDLTEYRDVLRQTVDLGIKATASFVLGFPDETKEDLDQTIELGYWSQKIGAKEVQFHRLSPLAGTKIYDDNREHFLYQGIGSDLSFLVSYSPEVFDAILKNPDLFSSFFVVPTPQLDPINVFGFAQFYFVLLKELGLSSYWIFEKKLKTPVQLYREWEEFYSENYPNQYPSPANIVRSFSEFI